MKTNVIMKRPMGQFEVQQRISDGYFDAAALLYQWNNVPGNTERKMARFFSSEEVKRFMDAVKDFAAAEGISMAAYIILFFVGLNFVFELIANIILSPAIYRLINIRKKSI